MTRKIFCTVMCVAAIFLAQAQAQAQAQADAAVGDAELGVYKGAGCTGVAKIPEFAKWYGKPPERALDFFSSASWKDMLQTASWSTQCWKNTPYHMTFSVPMLPKDDAGATLADGAQGRYDQYFQQLAEILVAKGFGDSILRIGWEFNGGWYPWAAAKDPKSWVTYWRRIVTTMRSVPGAHFRFDWNPVIGKLQINQDSVYPGDEYVDIIGADVYNQTWGAVGKSPEERWQNLLHEEYGFMWIAQFAAAHGKSISIPEWGTGTRPDGHGGGDDPIFVRKMGAWIRSHNVLYHDYWDYPAHDYNSQLSNGQYPQSGNAFLQSFRR